MQTTEASEEGQAERHSLQHHQEHYHGQQGPAQPHHEHHEHSGAGKRRITVATLLLAVLLVSTFALAIIFSGGPSYMGDDVAYSFFAHRVTAGQFSQAAGDILSIRIMQIYPIALFYGLLGVNSVSCEMWDVVALIGTMAATFLIGKELCNDYAGLLAALLVGLSPIAAVIATTMSDNVPMMFFASLGMLGILYGERRSSKRWYLVAGISLVAAVLVMPEGLIAFAVAFIYLAVQVLRGKVKLDRTLAYLAVGIALALIVTCTFNYFNAKSPFITFTSTFNFYQPQSNSTFSPANPYLGFYLGVMFPYNFSGALIQAAKSGSAAPVISALSNDNTTAGIMFYLLVPVAAYLIIRRERGAYFPLFWTVAGFLLLEFDPFHVSLFPFSYVLQHRLDRYLTLIAPPLALMVSIAVASILRDSKGVLRYAAAALCALVLLSVAYNSLSVIGYWHNVNLYQRYEQVAIAGYLSKLPSSTLVYYPNGFSITEIYMQFANSSRFNVYDQVRNCSDLPVGAYVVMPKNEQVFGIPFTPNPAPYCPSWRLAYDPNVASAYPNYIAGSASSSEAELYYIPSNSASSAEK
jgi:hypothetical protein